MQVFGPVVGPISGKREEARACRGGAIHQVSIFMSFAIALRSALAREAVEVVDERRTVDVGDAPERRPAD